VCNLIAEQPGTDRANEVLILGGHYDSVGSTPGADDNASAVAGVLEIAHQLSTRRFRRTIRYVAFVNEEPPFYKTDQMGSLVYARRCLERSDAIVGMINLEMIGYFSDETASQGSPFGGLLRRVLPDRGNFIVICGNLTSKALLARTAWGFHRSGARFPMIPFPSPRKVVGPDMSDHRSFWQCGYPAVMVTDTSFLRNPNYHRMTDLPETLNYPAMTRVVRGVTSSLARLAKPV
jgi:Zn-dependent M28 family amino/carboxypeptidase